MNICSQAPSPPLHLAGCSAGKPWLATVVLLVTLTLTSDVLGHAARRPPPPKPNLGAWHEQRAPITREHEKRSALEKEQIGVTHVEDFIHDVQEGLSVDRLYREARIDEPLLGGKRKPNHEPNFTRIGVTASKTFVNGQVLVTFIRIGFLQRHVAEKWISPPITVFDAYKSAFEPLDHLWTPQQISKGFDSAHLVLDHSLLVQTATTGWTSMLKLDQENISRAYFRWPEASEAGVSQRWYSPYRFETENGEAAILLRIRVLDSPGAAKKELLGVPPPTKFVKTLNLLRASAFSKSDLSIVLLEGESRTRDELLAAAKAGGPSVAMDLTDGALTNNMLVELEKRFALRAEKAIAVIGHYEPGADQFYVRSATGAVLGAIPRKTLLDWGVKYDVSVLLLGCRTAELGSENGIASTATNVNSLDVIRALSTASSGAKNWADFFALMSSADMPIVLGTQPKETGFGTATLRHRLASGRLRTVAEMSYYIRCRLWKAC